MPTHPADLPVFGGELLAKDGPSVPDGAPELPTVISATSWLIADADTGEVLAACSPHQPAAPASIQKLLLLLTIMDKLDPAQVVTFTQADRDSALKPPLGDPESTMVPLQVGGRYTIESVIYGLLMRSGNDAAQFLARLAGGGGDGGVAATVREMNAAARRIGALDTRAVTPSGLDGPGQATTAYDMALIMRELLKSEDFRRYTAAKNAVLPAQPHLNVDAITIRSDNRLVLNDYPGALGGKNGFTDIARHTYVGAARRDGRTLVVTLLGAEQRPVPTWQQAAALLDWGFALGPGKSVGHLVTPDEAQQLIASHYASERAEAERLAQERLAAKRDAARAADTTKPGGLTWGGFLGVIGAIVALAAVGVLLSVRNRRRSGPATARRPE